MNPRALVHAVATSAAGVRMRRRLRFGSSGVYWERRYARGGTSGIGSYGEIAGWKAGIVNDWVSDLGVASVLDLGCGDGNQLSLARYPRYLGMDRSETAIRTCIQRFESDPDKSFLRYDPESFVDRAGWFRADLTLSMEVLFHLVEDQVLHDYLALLFDSADRFVVVCSSDDDIAQTSPHELHRPFTPWITQNRPEWHLRARVDPPPHLVIASSLFLFGRDGVG